MFASAIARYLLGFGLVLATVGISWYAFKTKYYDKGWNDAIHAVAAKNAKAVKDADNARKDVETCFDSGGSWDLYTNSCLRGN